MRKLIFALIIFPGIAKPQDPNNRALKKWLAATVNIECRASEDTKGNYRYGTATAIYLKQGERHYLISARHVFQDTSKGRTDKAYNMILLIKNSSISDSGKFYNTPLMNAGTGTYSASPYVFSDTTTDIGIIYLDFGNQGRRFVDQLDRAGYIPISGTDIDMENNIKKGKKVFSLGYTGDFSRVGSRHLPPSLAYWNSDLISLPVFSEGTIGESFSQFGFLSANIFVHYGNSGAPLVLNGKLVGIVSGGIPQERKLPGTSLG